MADAGSSLKKVVIIGLGYAGAGAARALDDSPLAGKDFEVIGIDKNKAFWHSFGAVRATVNANFAQQFVIPFDNLITHGKVLKETDLTDITPTEVVTSTGERIAYDYLLIATGSTYRGFIKAGPGIDASLQIMSEIREAAAKPDAKVTIVGGGIVGLEFAGEIKHAFPAAAVTVVDANASVLSAYEWPEKLRNDVVGKLTTLGVKFILNERIALGEDDDGAYVKHRVSQLSSGATLESDVQILTTGNMLPNNALIKQTFLASALDESGHLKVNEYLQVEGHRNIFAIGDINNLPLLDTAVHAQSEAAAVAKSISTLVSKGNDATLKQYAPMFGHQMAFIALTPTLGAVAGFPFKGWSVTGWFGNKFTSFKGTDQLIGKIRGPFRQ